MDKLVVIAIGDKQYPVTEDETLVVEKIEGKQGDKITLDKVLLLTGDKKIKVGQPYLEKIKVKAEILEQFKDKKIRVAKFKAKSRYRRVKGHRQNKTRIKIIDIGSE